MYENNKFNCIDKSNMVIIGLMKRSKIFNCTRIRVVMSLICTLLTPALTFLNGIFFQIILRNKKLISLLYISFTLNSTYYHFRHGNLIDVSYEIKSHQNELTVAINSADILSSQVVDLTFISCSTQKYTPESSPRQDKNLSRQKGNEAQKKE